MIHSKCLFAACRTGIAVIALTLVSFGQSAAQSVPPTDNVPEFKIGAIISTTGAASSLGIPEQKAIELFTRLHAKKPNLSYNMEVISYDDSSDPTKAVTLTRKLIEEDKVDIVLCCTTTPSSLAIIDTISAAKVPMISLASAATIVEPTEARPFTFKTPTSDRLMLQRTVAYMKRQGFKSLAFMGLSDAYGDTGLKELKTIVEAEGMDLVAVERFSRDDTNFTPQALSIRQARPDVVYIHAIPPSADLAHQAVKRVGYTGPIFHGPGVAAQSFIDLGNEDVEGAYVGVGPVVVHNQLSAGNPIREVVARFATAYEKAYGNGAVDMFSGQGWDAISLAAHAIESVTPEAGAKVVHFSGDNFGSPSQETQPADSIADIRQSLESALEQRTRNYPSVNGIRNLSPTDHLGLDMTSTALAQVRNGRFVLVEE